MNLQPAEVIALLCQQRHDFLNDLQVVSGYIQLNKNERALSYLKQMFKYLEHSGRLMHLKYPELAFIAISRVEAAAAKGIVMQLEIHTLMENSLLEVDELIPLWTGAWDAALALTCSGSKLKVSLNYRDNYYYLRFVTNPFPQNAPELTDIANMARRAGMIFNYKADSGEISLCFAGSSSDS